MLILFSINNFIRRNVVIFIPFVIETLQQNYVQTMYITAEYWSNPQYFVKLTDPDETDDVDTCTLIVSLMQKFRRQMKTSTKKTENQEEAIGFDVLKVN